MLPPVLTAIISSIVPPESLSPTITEYLRKLRLDPYIIEELRLKAEELGFTYDNFKNAFLEVERLLR